MNKALIVAIFSPTTDAAGGDLGDSEGEIGTGYYVGPDLILTARHVAAPPRRNHQHDLAVAWHTLTPGLQQKLDWKQDAEVELVWCGEDDLDAALIRCPLPESLRGTTPGFLSANPPQAMRNWESRGFPAVMQRDDVHGHYDFSGAVKSATVKDPRFSLDETIAVGDPGLWKGASGMPVGTPNSDEIIGLVVEVPTQLDNRLFHAVPSHMLLADAGFCRHYLAARHQHYQRQTGDRIVQQLQAADSSVLNSHLAQAFGIQQADSGRRVAEIANEMLQHVPVDSLLDVAVTAPPTTGVTGSKRLRDVVLAVLPARQQLEMVDRMRRLRFGTAAGPLVVEATLPTVAELLMAATDRRSASFQAMRDQDDFPSGVNRLSPPPEGGRDQHGAQKVSDLLRDLLAIMEPEAGDGMAKRLTEFLRHSKLVQSDLRGYEWTDLRDYIVKELARAAEEKCHSYYFIVPPGTPRDCDQALTSLKREFPHLVFLRLAGGTLGEEHDRYSKLRDLLFQNPEQTT